MEGNIGKRVVTNYAAISPMYIVTSYGWREPTAEKALLAGEPRPIEVFHRAALGVGTEMILKMSQKPKEENIKTSEMSLSYYHPRSTRSR